MSLDYSKFIGGALNRGYHDVIGISKDNSGFRVQNESQTFICVSVLTRKLLGHLRWILHILSPHTKLVKLMH